MLALNGVRRKMFSPKIVSFQPALGTVASEIGFRPEQMLKFPVRLTTMPRRVCQPYYGGLLGHFSKKPFSVPLSHRSCL
jgi:hypothetical protein